MAIPLADAILALQTAALALSPNDEPQVILDKVRTLDSAITPALFAIGAELGIRRRVAIGLTMDAQSASPRPQAAAPAARPAADDFLL